MQKRPDEEADPSEKSVEEESSSGSLQAAQVDLITSGRTSQADAGNKSSGVVPHPTLQLDTHLRGNSTTLYRENRVEQHHEQDSSYDDVDMGGYDYGYEDFLYEYEDGFRGPKGEPGPVVSQSICCSKTAQLQKQSQTD